MPLLFAYYQKTKLDEQEESIYITSTITTFSELFFGGKI